MSLNPTVCSFKFSELFHYYILFNFLLRLKPTFGDYFDNCKLV